MDLVVKGSSNYWRIQRYMAQSEISQSVLSQWIVNKIYPDRKSVV